MSVAEKRAKVAPVAGPVTGPEAETAATPAGRRPILEEVKPEATAAAEPESPPKKKRWRRLLILALPLLLVAGGAYVWLTGGRYVTTDNAYVHQPLVAVSADVAGRIVEVDVAENQRIEAGAQLFVIDPEPYAIALDQADAALATARLSVEQLRAAHATALVRLDAAEAIRDVRQGEYDRQQSLADRGVASTASLDDMEMLARAAENDVALAREGVAAAAAALGGDPDIEPEAFPAVRAARAQRQEAERALAHATVVAPAAGIVSQIGSLNVGQYVAPGTAIASLVQSDDTWIEANFKETQLETLHAGQPVTVEIDAYPGLELPGEVESIGSATGSEFSLIPAQNATGNWVKVVQRVAVRVRIETDADHPLRDGMSAHVAVDTGASRLDGLLTAMAAAAQTLSKPAVSVPFPGLLTASIMLATIMQVLDTTIANVALPHMAASLGAAQEEITWVLTSYIVASAIATPLTGWMADRLGRRTLFAGAIAGFTLASLACGVATSLEEMVLFRVAQGVCGAVLIPLAQTVLLDINPREKIGQAMAIYGAGIMVGPIIGPTLGGWLTETFNWRFVFLVNLPVGILALAGVLIFLPETERKTRRFDIFGFAMLALAVGSLQMLLDRGQAVDWFSSVEIWLYLGLTLSGLWAFVIHCLSADDPFVDLRMFRDRNFTSGLVFIFIIGLTMFSGLALLPPLLQNLLGYPVIETGLVMAPRGVGTMLSMIVVGRLVSRVDARMLVCVGLAATGVSLWMMSGFDVMMDSRPIIVSGVIQGFGLGFVFVPLSTLTFATLAPHFRGDATSMFSLVRNVGSGVGISIVTTVLARMITVNHEELASRLTLDAPQVQHWMPGLLSGNPLQVAMADRLVSQQAAMISYIDNFLLMLVFTAAALPIVFFLRKPHPAAGPKAVPDVPHE